MTPKPKKTERITLALIVACTLLWLGAGLLWQTQFWFLGLLAMPILAAFQTSLQHETIHKHPTRWPPLNELLVSLPMAVVFPYRRYKELHLKHHDDQNLTDPYDDPESYFWPIAQYSTMRPIMRKLFEINNTFAGRLVIGPALTIVGFARTEIQRLRRNEPGVANAWLIHALELVFLGTIIIGLFAMPIWVYAIAVVYPALSLTAMRSYAEHQAAENVGGRSAIVETNPALALLYLNNNLHIVHHASPHTAWYDLPALYSERRAQFLAANGNALFTGYRDIARRFAFSSKQTVDHPFLRRDVPKKLLE